MTDVMVRGIARVLFVMCVAVSVSENSRSRKPKVLIFPTKSLLQVSIGVTVPVDIEFFRISINWCFQANFATPSDATDYTQGITGGVVEFQKRKRKRELREVSTGQLYRNLQSVLDDAGFNGEECILKSICQLAHIPIHKDDDGDLLAEILHLVLSPSEHNDNSTCCTMPYSNSVYSTDPDQVYLEAESRGAANGNCSALYPKCPHSPLDLYTSLEEY